MLAKTYGSGEPEPNGIYGVRAIRKKTQSRLMEESSKATRVQDFAKRDTSSVTQVTTVPASMVAMVASGRPEWISGCL